MQPLINMFIVVVDVLSSSQWSANIFVDNKGLVRHIPLHVSKSPQGRLHLELSVYLSFHSRVKRGQFPLARHCPGRRLSVKHQRPFAPHKGPSRHFKGFVPSSKGPVCHLQRLLSQISANDGLLDDGICMQISSIAHHGTCMRMVQQERGFTWSS